MISTQVLQELYVNDGRSILRALEIEERDKISFWDAMVVQAATDAGVAVLYTEDLSHGQRYGTVEVRNPFRRGASSQ